MTIYVAFGFTGENADYSAWPVKSFFSEAKAKEYCVFANNRSRDIYTEEGGWDSWNKARNQLQNKEVVNEYDPKMRLDYTGTNYYYIITELE